MSANKLKQNSLETQATCNSPTLSDNISEEDSWPQATARSTKTAIINTVSDSIYKFKRRELQDLLFEESINDSEIQIFRDE